MRYREPFTVFPRKMKSGRVVWYYQTYDERNRRTTARSTGQTSKGAARVYCNKLFKEDALIPNRGGNILFASYAVDWWVWDKCEYLKYRRSRRELSPTYADTAMRNFKKHVLPHFEKSKLKDITSYDVEKWLLSFASKGLSNLTANVNLSVVNIMMADAVRRDLLDINPVDRVSPLKKDTRERDILTADEVSRIFDKDSINKIWKDRIYYLANLLSACTGMRVSEILAIRGETLFKDHILVSNQYNSKYGLIPTKTKATRQIPIPNEIYEELKLLSIRNGGKYLFSTKDGEVPVSINNFNKYLKEALTNIGIKKKEQVERNLSFHGWRHFFNTTMRTNNISDSKLQKLTGHKTMAMTDRYTHFKANDFQDVKKIQAKILQMPRKVG